MAEKRKSNDNTGGEPKRPRMTDTDETPQPSTSTCEDVSFTGQAITPSAAQTIRKKSQKRKGKRKNVIKRNVIGSAGVIAGEISGEVNVQYVSGRSCGTGQRNAEAESEQYQKLCKVSEGHVRTTLYQEVSNKLDNTNSVTVLGNAGDGKTTLLHLVCLEYSTRGYLTIEIDRPEDIHKYLDANKPVLFVCDNLMGRIVMDHDKKKSWINSDCDKLISDKVKILFACRFELWREHETQLDQNPMFKDTADVRSKKLTNDDKTEMIEKHLGDKITRYTKEFIVKRSSFAFPECCRFVSHSRDIDFTDTDKLVQTFTNPFRFVMTTLETIAKSNKHQYATLVLCLLNKRKLPTTDTSDTVKQLNFEVVRNLYLSDTTCSVEQVYDELLDKATELNGWMLTKTDDYYDFYHDCIFEAVCRVHGARYPEHVLNFCEPKTGLTVFTTKQISGSDRVFLPSCCYPKLCEIVTEECVNEWTWYGSDTWRFVFAEMNREDILKQWQKFLSKSLPSLSEKSDILVTNPALADVLLLMSERPDKDIPVDDVFLCAAEHGDSETSKLLIDYGVTIDGRGEGLCCAARKGHSEIVKMIVGQRDLGMRYVERGLREAIWSDRGECVIGIMSLQPDIDTDTIHSLLQEAVRYDSLSCVCELLNRCGETDTIHKLLKKAVEWDSVKCLGELLNRDGDRYKIHDLVQKAVRRDSVRSLCELLKRDIRTDTIHSLLQEAVFYGHVEAVQQLVKHQAVSRDYVQSLLDTEDCELFRPATAQTDRDKIRQLLSAHINTDF